MTAPDHATSHSQNTLRERGHPYMTLGASDAGADAPRDWHVATVCGSNGYENIDCMVTRGRLERRERRTARAGLDGHGGQPVANRLPGMRRTVQIAPQHILANAPGFGRSRSAGHCECPPGALEVSKPAV
jgi:hypothetical protein